MDQSDFHERFATGGRPFVVLGRPPGLGPGTYGLRKNPENTQKQERQSAERRSPVEITVRDADNAVPTENRGRSRLVKKKRPGTKSGRLASLSIQWGALSSQQESRLR